MDPWLITLMQAGALRPIDAHFAELMQRLCVHPAPEVTLAAAVLSRHCGEGHVCLPLERLAGGECFPDPAGIAPQAPALRAWMDVLLRSGIAGAPGTAAPLILDSAGRLYLERLWRDETTLATRLRALAAPRPDVDPAMVRAALAPLFPGEDAGGTGQRRGAAIAALNSLAVISGGPGTGKTTAVTRLLAALIALAGDGPAPRIALAAPTGKAAARLAETLHMGREGPGLADPLRAALPTEVRTVHRLLGYRPQDGGFRHGPENPLPCEVLVVDEASMVDLPMMTRLVEALPQGARLVLLGDRDQLASVDAGAVLGDICVDAGRGYSVAAVSRLEAATGDAPPAGGPGGVGDAIALLEHSYRFAGGGGIGRLAAAVRAGDAPAALAVLRESSPELGWAQPGSPAQLASRVGEWAVQVYGALGSAAGPDAALAVIEGTRVLAALREGPYGVAGLNTAIERALRRAGVLRGEGLHYPGRPLLVTRNAPELGLFNGDLGVLFPDSRADGALRAWFHGADGALRAFAPGRLPTHETVYAMTVHKAQGSECDSALLVLPPEPTPVATRELVYTALTRARAHLAVWATEGALTAAIGTRSQRDSGLAAALWAP